MVFTPLESLKTKQEYRRHLVDLHLLLGLHELLAHFTVPGVLLVQNLSLLKERQTFLDRSTYPQNSGTFRFGSVAATNLFSLL